ncbi:hypothetical protein [Polyangium spumosum]|uniref:Tryptophan synthase alpha chain n=1 Tax=Polyangium spumosum TaxID=889282 RepID=A0A6N7Q365_9BACT|nr:hypothetical protein [Polyangium spumosum]MRG97280.1 hypothetical protein [Polyangium spumosum]
MNRMSWLLVVPLALVSALSVPAGCVEFQSFNYDSSPNTGGAGGEGGVGGGTGGTGAAPACTTPADCPDNECRSGGSCNAGKCEWTTVQASGTPAGTPVYGDCKRRECGASGAVTEVDDQSDKYDWGNPCYKDACSAWTAPQPDPLRQCTAWGKAGLCDTSFKCNECTGDGDCGANKCVVSIGKCVPAHCMDGVFESLDGETDLDCGGPCAPCAVGLKCNQRTDCDREGTCMGNPKVCLEPNCNDGAHNGDETDADCGGACAQDMANPKKCAETQGCLVPDDCQTGFSCKAGTCQP